MSLLLGRGLAWSILDSWMANRSISCKRLTTGLLLSLVFALLLLMRQGHGFNIARAATAADDPDQLDASSTIDLKFLQDKFQTIAKNVAPAVVAISAVETAPANDAGMRADELNPQKLQGLLDKTTRTVGTGFIIDPDGFILTNEHVVEDSQQYWVTTDDRKVYPAVVVGADPRADLAVLKIPAGHLPIVRFNQIACTRGQWALTLGNPYGLATEGEMALSVGVVSATERSLPRLASKENRLYSNLIQTTAQINPGNSGGPLFDINGQVIGINTAVILPQKQTNGIGFAIPVNSQLLAEVDSLRQGREIIYAYIGVSVVMPTDKQRHDLSLSDGVGVCVESIEQGSPAATSALVEGDIIIRFNDQPVIDTEKFVRMVGAASIDKPVPIQLIRGNKRSNVQIVPIKRPVQYAISQETQRLFWRGMALGPVPKNWLGASQAAMKDGACHGILVIGIEDDSPFKKQGISAGSVITSIAGRPVTSVLDLQKVLNDVPADQCAIQLSPTAQMASMQNTH